MRIGSDSEGCRSGKGVDTEAESGVGGGEVLGVTRVG